MRTYHLSWAALLGLLALLTFVSSCNVCRDDEGDANDDVRCAGNILSEATSGTGADPDNVDKPRLTPITVGDVSFEMFETEVTNAQYATFLKELGAKSSESGDGQNNDCNTSVGQAELCYQFSGPGVVIKNTSNEDTTGGKARISEEDYTVSPESAADHPVTYVSWYGANEFCRTFDMKLPTEDQWEIAARQDKGADRYPWGDSNAVCEFANFEGVADGQYCVANTVGVKNGLYSDGKVKDSSGTIIELFHMAGNAAEWTRTIDSADDDKPDEEQDRVIKGGGFDSGVSALNITSSSLVPPTTSRHNIGFRCVK